MLRWRRVLTRGIAEAVALARCRAAPRAGFRVLMYHAVGSPVHGDGLGIFSISPQRFCVHADLLAKMPGARMVPLEPLDLPQQTLRVAVTFDDGYRDNLHVAAPMLIERGIPFSVFVTTDFVRNGVQGFLNPEELKELAGLPSVSIGAHGRSHRPLTECDDRALADELAGSKHYLEDLLGRTVTALAYPHGAADLRVRDAAERAGYVLGVCSHFDINRHGRDPLMLCRCNILRDDSPRVLRQKLRGDWDWYRWRSSDPLKS
jgi:peptidoglycan/xylan/chitin deacetylase (PgdA/CDA1 family)